MNNKLKLIIIVTISSILMGVVDVIIVPSYMIKLIIEILLFSILSLICFKVRRVYEKNITSRR